MIQLPVVFYVRVSSAQQKEAHTVEGQIESLNAWCDREGITPAMIYRDEGLNGDLPFLSRPGGTQLLADAKAGKFATVLVYLFDRFSRDVYEGLAAAKLLKESGAFPYSILEPFDITSPHGQYMFISSLNNAQLNKAQFLERTKAGSRRKARAGAYLGGIIPYGYRLDGRGPTARLVAADEDEVVPGLGMTQAGVVRWMFQLAAGGATTYKLAEMLNARAVPTKYGLDERRAKTKGPHKGYWMPATVYQMLTNTTYKGIHQYGKRSGDGKSANPASNIIERPCAALVTPEIWDTAREVLRSNLRYSRRTSDRKYLLRGLIRCDLCGRNFSGTTYRKDLAEKTGNEQGVIYVCNSLGTGPEIFGAAYGEETRRCRASSVSGKLEKAIWEKILEILEDPGSVAEAVANRAAESRKGESLEELQGRLGSIESVIVGKESERTAVLTLFRRSRITTDALDTQLDAIDAEENVLKAEAAALQEKIAAMGSVAENAQSVEIYLMAVRARLQELIGTGGTGGSAAPTWETKREIVEKIIQRITVNTLEPAPGKRRGDTIVTVEYRFGPLTDNRPL